MQVVAAIALLTLSQIGWAWHEGDGAWHTYNMERVGYNREVATERDGGGAEVWVVPEAELAFVGSVRPPDSLPEVPPSQMAILDISDPANPEMLSRVDTFDGHAPDVKANEDGSVAFIGIERDRRLPEEDRFPGFYLVDTSDPRNPEVVSQTRVTLENGDEDFVHNGFILGDTLYITARGVQIYDIADPANPTLLSSTEEDLCSEGDLVDENKVYGRFRGSVHDMWAIEKGERTLLFASASSCGLQTFDVTDPSNPELLSEWRDPDNEILFRGHTSVPNPQGTLLWHNAEMGSGFVGLASIIDISDPGDPQLVTTWTRPGPQYLPPDMRLDDESETGPGGPQESPHNISWCNCHNPSWNEAGTMVTVGAFGQGVWVVDLTEPSNPQVVGQYGPEDFEPIPEDPAKRAFRWARPHVWMAHWNWSDGYIYASDRNSGVYVLDLVDEHPWD